MKWRQFHRDAFERWEKRGGKNYSLIGDQLERIFMGGGDKYRYRLLYKHAWKIAHGKMVSRQRGG